MRTDKAHKNKTMKRLFPKRKKDVGVYFQTPKKLKKRLDRHLIDSEQTLSEYFKPLIEADLDYFDNMDKLSENS